VDDFEPERREVRRVAGTATRQNKGLGENFGNVLEAHPMRV